MDPLGLVKRNLLIFKRIRSLQKLYPLSTIARDVVLLPFDILMRRGKISRINNVTIALTDKCNARCSVCFFDKSLNRHEDRLTLASIKKLIDDVKKFKPCVILTGGEPFLHREIVEIIAYIKKSGLPLMIFTNGYFLDRVIDAIVREKVEYIGISVFGPREVHNRITRTDSFDKVVANVRALVERKGATEVILNCTITEENAAFLDFPLQLAAELGCDGVRYQHLSYFTAAEVEAMPKSEIYAKPAIYVSAHNPGRKILEALKGLRIPKGMRVQFVPTFPPEEMERWYSDDPGKVIRRRCIYLWRGVHVDTSGDVFPCYKIAYPLGNILDTPLSEVLQGDKYRRFRLLFKKNGVLPICRRCCKL